MLSAIYPMSHLFMYSTLSPIYETYGMMQTRRNDFLAEQLWHIHIHFRSIDQCCQLT